MFSLSFLATWSLSAWWREKTLDSCSFFWILLGLWHKEVGLVWLHTHCYGCGPGSLLSIITFLLLGLISRSHQTLIPSMSFYSILKAPRSFSVSTCPAQAVGEQELYFSSHLSELLSNAVVLHTGFDSIIPESSFQGSLGSIVYSKQNRRKCRLFQFFLSLHKMPLPAGTLAQRRGLETWVSYAGQVVTTGHQS